MESRQHELLKEAALTELEKEGYYLYVEPSDPPSWRLDWSLYRPDIAGTFTNEAEFWFVLVECETNPNIKRIRRKVSKIKGRLTFQNRLNETYLFRLLLVIPAGMLNRVNCSDVRLRWEIWIVNYRGEIIHKIPRKECARPA
jgi:hypothetical protein